MIRSTGVLLSISSLPSKHGIGCFDQTAYDFVDWLAKSGQTFWQILPLGPTSYGKSGDSPYQSFSAFAGNPYFIDLEQLVNEGCLEKEALENADLGSGNMVDYDKLHTERYKLLRAAYEHSGISMNPEYWHFIDENSWWLNDYALFMALKEFFGLETYWYQWPEDIRLHWNNAIDYYNEKLYYDIEFQKFMQFHFYRQWFALKKYANEKHIRIIGDIPIYVSLDSADAWAHTELFQLNEHGYPTDISGCPPDAFAAEGQIWGNPLYRWDYHRYTDYEWWTSRMWNSFRLYDVVRIDHFRGFDEYFSIPYTAETALEGHWEKGPNMDLFRRLEAHLGKHTVIAEDLGYMTDTVRLMVAESGFPNMKVLEFGFDEGDIGAANDYLPHNFTYNCVAYTGTHDNDTVVGWYQSLSDKEREKIEAYTGCKGIPEDEINWAFISMVQRSVAKTTIFPMQDYLGLGNDSRMNQPSTVGMNWRWRLKEGSFDDELSKKVKANARLFGRLNWDNEPKDTPAEETK